MRVDGGALNNKTFSGDLSKIVVHERGVQGVASILVVVFANSV